MYNDITEQYLGTWLIREDLWYVKVTRVINYSTCEENERPDKPATFEYKGISYDLEGIDINIDYPKTIYYSFWISGRQFLSATHITNPDEILLLDLRFMEYLLNA